MSSFGGIKGTYKYKQTMYNVHRETVFTESIQAQPDYQIIESTFECRHSQICFQTNLIAICKCYIEYKVQRSVCIYRSVCSSVHLPPPAYSPSPRAMLCIVYMVRWEREKWGMVRIYSGLSPIFEVEKWGFLYVCVLVIIYK